MSDAGTPDDLERELDAVRNERDALREKVEKAERRKRSRLRSVLVVVLVVLSVVSLAAAVPGTWGRRTVLNTDRYVATVGPLASDPAIQQLLATEITNATFDALDVQQRIQSAITERAPNLGFIAAPLTSALHDFVQSQVLKIVSSDAFARYWTEANRVVHEAAISTLEGGNDVVAVVGGKVVLNYLPLVNQALGAVATTASDLIGKPIDLPEITSQTVPADAIAMLEDKLNVDLPDTFGTLVVYDSKDLGAAQDAFQTFNRLVFLLVFLMLITAAGALWLSPRKRRTLLQLFVAYAVVLVIERRLGIAGGNQIVASVGPEFTAATRAVVDALLATLLRYTGWLLAISLAVVVVALITGPYAWAVATRRGVVGLARAVADPDRSSPAAVWIASHRDLVMFGAAAVGIVLLLFLDLSLLWSAIVVLLVGAIELLAWRAATPSSTREPS